MPESALDQHVPKEIGVEKETSVIKNNDKEFDWRNENLSSIYQVRNSLYENSMESQLRTFGQKKGKGKKIEKKAGKVKIEKDLNSSDAD